MFDEKVRSIIKKLKCDCGKTQLNLHEQGKVICNNCRKHYSLEKNFVNFLEENDSFYEGGYTGEIKIIPDDKSTFGKFLIWLINSGYLKKIAKNIPQNSVLLELGCAGGIRYLGEKYKTIGMDLSGVSLKGMNAKYELLIKGNCLNGIPLKTASLDGIASSFFWEHIENDKKDFLLKEFYRVLKPKGIIVMLFDVETFNPLIKWAKNKNHKLYQDLFINGDKHWGYETFDENSRRFIKGNFKVKEMISLEKTFIQSRSTLKKLSLFNSVFYYIYNKLDVILKKRIVEYLIIFLVRITDTVIGKFLPNKWGRICMCVLQKK